MSVLLKRGSARRLGLRPASGPYGLWQTLGPRLDYAYPNRQGPALAVNGPLPWVYGSAYRSWGGAA